MTLTRRLGAAWLWSFIASALSFATTIATVRLAGAEAFADFFVDLAKLSLIAVLTEILPTAYFAVKLQKDRARLGSLLHGYLLIGVLCAAIGSVVYSLEGFASPSLWMFAYLVGLPLHRLAQVELQSTGRTYQMFQLNTATAAIRFAVLVSALLLTAAPENDVLWAAMALGHVLGVLAWAGSPSVRAVFALRGAGAAITSLWADRSVYAEYYLNSVLKRARDTSLPILAGIFISDTTTLARYFLVMRGVDFVLGQLRVLEHFAMNFANRISMSASRKVVLTILAFGGYLGAVAAGGLLGTQAGLSWRVAAMAALASLFVFPYVVELISRADAYLEYRPTDVTRSLLVFLSANVAGFFLLSQSGWLSDLTLVIVPVIGQSLATVSYRLSRGSTASPG